MLKYKIKELIVSFLDVKAMGLGITKTSHPHLFPALLARTVSGRVSRNSMPCKIMSVMEWLGRLKWWPTGVSNFLVLTVDL